MRKTTKGRLNQSRSTPDQQHAIVTYVGYAGTTPGQQHAQVDLSLTYGGNVGSPPGQQHAKVDLLLKYAGYVGPTGQPHVNNVQ
jgi:cephalosporin-C deacetylase-like acetyl esterase